jgi:hypothetical protein
MKRKLERGGVLLATLVFVTVLSASAAAVLGLSLYSYRLALRNEVRAQAKAVADTEMDWVYYQFMNLILTGTDPWDTVGILATTLPAETGAVGSTVIPTIPYDPFLKDYQTAGWKVRRSLVYDRPPLTGQIPGTQDRGTIYYIDVRVEVLPPPSNSFAGSVTVRAGRYFQCSRTSVFQFAIFFQGDLEMAPGRDMTVNGDISANGSIYMGTWDGGNHATITLNNQVRYLKDDYFNTLSDRTTTTYREPNTPDNPHLTVDPVFGTSQATQVVPMDKPENLLGGVDADALVAARPDLFPTVNDVYRSLIAPSPDDAGSQEYPLYNQGLGDDTTIIAQRMYTRASLRITVDADGTVHFRKNGASTDLDPANFAGVLTDFSPPPHTSPVYVTTVYDQREAMPVNVTEIDVSALQAKLVASFPGTDPNDPAVTFDGTLYVNLKNGDTNRPPSIRLINAATTPTLSSKGFSVATNGGIYVVGNYNTEPTNHDYVNPVYNPAMLMGDAVTLLSTNWNDANAANPDVTARPSTGGTVTIAGGVLTGNVSATATTISGGAQNLLRYLENWTGTSVSVLGSIGRLFDSKYYIRPFQQPGTVYLAPDNRTFTYSDALQTEPPPDAPMTTNFSRGSYFYW